MDGCLSTHFASIVRILTAECAHRMFLTCLPHSNGEGQRGYLEDLNELVSAHIRLSLQKYGVTETAVSSLHSDLVDILAMGMLTLQTKLLNLTNDKLLVRIVSYHPTSYLPRC